jgi:hypothetical protein
MWNGHVAGFVAINAFLIFIDLITGGGLWFPFVTGGMAIPFLGHYIHKQRKDSFQRNLENRLEHEPGFPDRMFRPFRKLHRSMTHLLMGLGSAVAVSGYLFLINAMTGGRFWAIIPAASIALPAVFHTLFTRARRRALIETLESGGDDLDDRRRASRRALRQSRRRLGAAIDRPDSPPAVQSPADVPPGDHPMVIEAKKLEQQIVTRLPGAGSTEVELQGGVRDLVGEIERLCELSYEFAAAVRTISPSELQKDQAVLTRRQREGASETMMRQYSAALEQVERQIASLQELESRKELLDLRIRTGVNSLRQINVDLVRMQGDAALGDINQLVQSRTGELSAYLSDLQQSYEELSQDLGG